MAGNQPDGSSPIIEVAERPKIAWPIVGMVAAAGLVLLTAALLLYDRAPVPATKSAPTPATATATLAKVQGPPGALIGRPETIIEWNESDQPTGVAYVIGELVVEVRPKREGDSRLPVLRVTAPTGEVYEAVGQEGFEKAAATFGVGRLDPASDLDQVIFMTFSGGAHCCTQITILDLRNGAWREIDAGVWDGKGFGEFPTDIDGDDRAEMVMADNAFNYAFDAYAGSRHAPVVLELRGGRIVDVSAAPRYRALHESELKELQADCRQASNAACAAFVAVAARLGRTDQAWGVMIASYDRNSDWSLPTACRRPRRDAACAPGDEVVFATFPEALRWFLGDHGYLPPAYISPAEPASGPSFDCTKASSDVLRLICFDPELSRADRELARVYSRAMALTGSPAQIRAEEWAFINRRNNASADKDLLLGLYRERILELRQIAGE